MTIAIDVEAEREAFRKRREGKDREAFCRARAKMILQNQWNATEAALRESIRERYPDLGETDSDWLLQIALETQRKERPKIDPSTVLSRPPEIEKKTRKTARAVDPFEEPELAIEDEITAIADEPVTEILEPESVIEPASTMEETVPAAVANQEAPRGRGRPPSAKPSEVTEVTSLRSLNPEARKAIDAICVRIVSDPEASSLRFRQEVRRELSLELGKSVADPIYYAARNKAKSKAGTPAAPESTPREPVVVPPVPPEQTPEPIDLPDDRLPLPDPEASIDDLEVVDLLLSTGSITESIPAVEAEPEYARLEGSGGRWRVQVDLRFDDVLTAANVLKSLLGSIPSVQVRNG